jgi:hypothetical protein
LIAAGGCYSAGPFVEGKSPMDKDDVKAMLQSALTYGGGQ